MKYSETQKAALLEKYMSFVKYKVSNYYKTVQLPYSGCWEDLFQEAMLAFYKHLDKIDNEWDVFTASVHMFRAMNRYKESLNVLNVAHDVYATHGGCSRLSLEEWDGVEDSLSQDEMIDYQAFYSQLSDKEQLLWDLREAGYKNVEIAKKLQLSEACISKRIKKLLKRLAEYLRCDD